MPGDAEAGNRRTVEKLIEAINGNRLEDYYAQFDDRMIIEYPQSGERIVGKENLRRIYGSIPKLPSFKTTRLLAGGDLVVAEAVSEYPDGRSYLTVLICQLRDGKIVRESAYWADPFDAPASRAPYVERFPVPGRK